MIHQRRSWLRVLFLAASGLLVVIILAAGNGQVGALPTSVVAPANPAISGPLLHYQARLLDPATSQPKPDGPYQMSFKLYASEVGGLPLWMEAKEVTVSNGVFSALLGDVTPLNVGVFDGRALWLGITVGADPEATPRQPIAYVAYAMYANRAGSASTATAAELAANSDRLGGNLPSFYTNASNLTSGTLAWGLFSAYDNLANNGKIGAAAGKVAAGIHAHTGADIADGSLGAIDLADGSVTSVKIADGGVANADLANSSVDSAKIADLSVLAADLAANSVTSAKIGDGGVGNIDLADGSVNSAKIADSSVANADLAANSVDSAKITDSSVGTIDLTNRSVTSEKIADGAVTTAKLASGVAPKFFAINLFGAFVRDGVTFSTGWGPNAGMWLPDSSTPDFTYSFVIPPDYTSGTDMTVRFIWHTPATSCGIELRPNFISVARAGSTHIAGHSVSDGLTLVGGSTLSAPSTANRSSAKEMTINTPVPGTPLMGGDSIIFGLFRSSTAPTDTCANSLVIQGVSVSYQ